MAGRRMKDMTHAELMAEVLGLGGTPKKKKRRRKQRKPKLKPTVLPELPHKTVSPLAELAELDMPAPSALHDVFDSKYLRNVRGGFDNKERRTPRAAFKRGRLHVPSDMFTHRDIAEFMGCDVAYVVRIGGLLGYMSRVNGSNRYAPLTRAQAKAIIHHLHCRGM